MEEGSMYITTLVKMAYVYMYTVFSSWTSETIKWVICLRLLERVHKDEYFNFPVLVFPLLLKWGHVSIS